MLAMVAVRFDAPDEYPLFLGYNLMFETAFQSPLIIVTVYGPSYVRRTCRSPAAVPPKKNVSWIHGDAVMHPAVPQQLPLHNSSPSAVPFALIWECAQRSLQRQTP